WGPPKVDLGVLSRAWTCLQANFSLWISSCLVVGLLFLPFLAAFVVAILFVNPAFQSLFTGKQPQMDLSIFFGIFAIELVGAFVLHAVSVVLNALLINLALIQLAGQPASVGTMFNLRGQSGQLMVLGLISAVATMIGMMFCYVPAFIV